MTDLHNYIYILRERRDASQKVVAGAGKLYIPPGLIVQSLVRVLFVCFLNCVPNQILKLDYFPHNIHIWNQKDTFSW